MDKYNMHLIFKDCGLVVSSCGRVHGGDINEAFCLSTTKGRYFLKVNNAAAFPAMFEKEADGLDALRKNFRLTVPRVVRTSAVDGKQYVLLEWLDKGNLQADTWAQFGQALALMHQRPRYNFGWHTDNYIGSLHQPNTKRETWESFFADCRVLPLVKSLVDAGIFTKEIIRHTERFCSQTLFPEEPPSLLHGDLWSGNFMIANNGSIAIYDPAVYYGHREMDIGMTMLFGGFDTRFYEAYNDVYPLAPGWRDRLPVTQLYPLLVHAVIFGGHYVIKVREIIRCYGQ